MLFSNCAARRAVTYGIAAGITVGTMLFGAAPAAIADPAPAPVPPGCTAADIAQATAGVMAATAEYLFAHPDVNAALSSVERPQPREDVRADIENYLTGNPQAAADLRGIRQPLTDLQDRCR